MLAQDLYPSYQPLHRHNKHAAHVAKPYPESRPSQLLQHVLWWKLCEYLHQLVDGGLLAQYFERGLWGTTNTLALWQVTHHDLYSSIH